MTRHVGDRLKRDRLVFAAIAGAVVLCGVLLWIALFAIGGRILVGIVALVEVVMAGFVAWWLRTWDVRNAKLPRARARRGRGRR